MSIDLYSKWKVHTEFFHLGWKDVDHFLYFHHGPDPKLKEGNFQQALAWACVSQTLEWLSAHGGNIEFSILLFSFLKGHAVCTGLFFKLFIQLYPDKLQLPPV